MDFLDKLINKVIEWIDAFVQLIKGYSQGYSKYIVYIVGILALSMLMKGKVNLNANIGKKA